MIWKTARPYSNRLILMVATLPLLLGLWMDIIPIPGIHKSQGLSLVLAVLVGGAGVGAIKTYFTYVKIMKEIDGGTATLATILESKAVGSVLELKIRFGDHRSTLKGVRPDVYDYDFQVGAKIPVVYNPLDPSEVYLIENSQVPENTPH